MKKKQNWKKIALGLAYAVLGTFLLFVLIFLVGMIVKAVWHFFLLGFNSIF